MRIAVIGGSIAGLASALFLARDGHDVVVLEGDDTEAPERMGARDLWFRRGTPHSRQAHAFLGLFVKTMRGRAPDVLEDIIAAGAVFRAGESLKPMSIGPVDGIEDLAEISARRPMVEAAMRRAALDQKGIEFRIGAHVTGLEARSGPVPVVTGVKLGEQGSIEADVVIDASGRRTQVDRWLAAIDAQVTAPDSYPCGMVYVGRYYVQATSEGLPALNAGFVSVFGYPWGTALMFPGDNGVMQFAFGVLTEDEEIRRRAVTEEGFHAFAAATPHIGDWIACAEPISDVGVMAGLRNYVRRLVSDDEPVVLGLHLTGDAAAITNPQFGRGVSHAVGHADAVASAISRHPDDLLAQARAVDDEVERMLVPSVQDSIENDEVRTRAWRTALTGGEASPPTIGGFTMAQLNAAMESDPVVWKAIRSSAFMLQPPGSWKRDEEVVERIRSVDVEPPAPPPPGPSRAELIEAMDRASL